MKLGDLVLLGLAGLAAVLVFQNWKGCTTQITVVDANGNPAPAGLVAGPGYHQVSTSIFPSPGCLLNPFPGGL